MFIRFQSFSRKLIPFTFCLVLGLACVMTPALTFGESVFRFSLSTEPSHFDPARITSSESNYFVVNLLRGLYVINEKGESEPEIAESCKYRSQLIVECKIKNGANWSDGKPITAEDFLKSWSRLVSVDAKGLGISILSTVKNATAIHSGKKNLIDFGVRAKSAKVLEIALESPDSDFFEKLAHPALSVVREDGNYARSETANRTPVSGPYQIAEWTKSNRIRLTSNPQFDSIRPGLHKKRPDVELLIVEDDETAFNLYREGTLSFLRRLPTHYLKDWKKSPELFQIPVVRFDYVGFGPALKDQPELRKALAQSANYNELKVLYSALGVPGCPGISPKWMNHPHCHQFNPAKAKQHFSKVPESVRSSTFVLQFSKLGGDDIQKGMEWFQAQWKTNLGFKVDLQPLEQSVFVTGLKKNPPAIFRKGVGLDRASCLAAVEIFSAGDGENYIQLDNPKYNEMVSRLRASKKSAKASTELCGELVKILIDEAFIIPLGRIHFSLLAKPGFKGWVLTPLNQLDLSRLEISK